MQGPAASLQEMGESLVPTQEKAQASSARAFVFHYEFDSYCAVIVTLPVAADFTKFASPL
jgi:hypothetical protein